MKSLARADLVLLVSLWAAAWVASPLHLPLNNPNEGVRVFMVRALVEQRTFAIDAVIKDWGYIDDKARHDGHLYSSKAPLPSLLGAMAYGVVHPFSGELSRPTLTRLARFAGDGLPTLLLLTLLLVTLRARLQDAATARLAVASLCVSTGVLAAMNVFSGHAIAALASACALALALRPRSPREAAMMGALLAAAVGSEYPSLLALAPLLVLFVVNSNQRRRDVVAMALGAAPIAALVAAAHTAMFGAPWRTGYSFLENKSYGALVEPGVFGIGAPHADALVTSMLSPELGLLWFAPSVCVGLWALGQRTVPRAARLACASALVLMGLFIAGFKGWRGGWSVGPRYILELAGVFTVLGAVWVDAGVAAGRAAPRRAWLVLAGAGLLSAGVAGALFPHLPDALHNPVGELVLPLLRRGFAPDSLPLGLGLPPALSCVVIVLVIAAPLVLASVRMEALALVTMGAGTMAVLAVLLTALVPARNPDATGAEVRRMFDNFRPDAGNPILAAAPDDVRALVAIDRGRAAWGRLLQEGCALAADRAPRGPLAEAVSRTPPGSLLVVPDRFAPVIADVALGPLLVVSATDVTRHGRQGLPCTGDVLWLDIGAPPRALAALQRGEHEGPLLHFKR